MYENFFEYLQVIISTRSRVVDSGRGVASNACVQWNGAISKNGYGFVHLNLPNKKKLHTTAHRVAFMLNQKIFEIPKKDSDGNILHVSHLCHNTTCVNAEHLSLEPQQLNQERKMCVKSGCCLGHSPACLLQV